MQIMTLKFGSRVEDVEEHLNEFLELLRRHDEANGANPDRQVKKACIISNALDTSSAERLTAGKLRWASRGDRRYSRGRRIFKTTSNANTPDDDPMEVDALSRKGMQIPQGQQVQRQPHGQGLQ